MLRSVAKHSPELAQAVVDSGALDALVPCLEEFDPSVKEAAGWALGYIAGHTGGPCPPRALSARHRGNALLTPLPSLQSSRKPSSTLAPSRCWYCASRSRRFRSSASLRPH